MYKGLYRFAKYSAVGGGTFLLDLGFLFILTDILQVHYVAAASGAFLVAVSLNYLISRHYVFQGSQRDQREGYGWFIIIALSGMGIVAGMMYVLVTWLALHYLMARIIVAAFTGIWNYLLNLYFNFKVAGVHIDRS